MNLPGAARRLCLPAAVLAAGVMLVSAPGRARAQEMEAPVAVQVPLMIKILSFDRNLRARAGDELVIGVAYQSRNRASAIARDEVVAALRSQKFRPIADVPFRVVSIDLDEVSDLGAALRDDNVRVLYVAPLRAFALGTIVEATRTSSVTTVTGVPEYVQQGLAVGIVLRGDHPSILINLTASRREGAEFAAQLLQLAEIVR